MKISRFEGEVSKSKAEAVIIPFYEDRIPSSSMEFLRIDRIPESVKNTGFTGKKGQVFRAMDTTRDQMQLWTGLGKESEYCPETFRRSYSSAYSYFRDSKIRNCLIILPGTDNANEAFEAAYILKLTLYSFDEFRSEKTSADLKEVYIATGEKQDIIDGAVSVAEATNFTRNLANLPPSRGTPSMFEERSREIENLKITVLGRDDFIRMGMGGIEGVSRAAKEPAKMIIMEYGSSDEKPIMIVGKGITFDSGGISIKPADNMDEMKFDKCGASTVLGIMKLASDLKLKKHIVGIMPLTENLPGGNAYKPGDILKHYNGKTSEVLSTDAEGRLVLADALAYGVEKYNPATVIDIATLTGACVIALGNNIAGLMGNDRDLKEKLKKASERTWEKVWEMPIDDDFRNQIKSEVADIKNIGGKEGGAETAGAFLEHFVNGRPWVHLDIAGTAWTQAKTAKADYLPKGATGFGVRLLYEFLCS